MPEPSHAQPSHAQPSHAQTSHGHGGHSHAPHGSHAHGGGSHGSHAPVDFGRAFLIGIVLNTGFVLVEATYGFLANSVALLADAGHNLSDVLSLVVAWVASVLARRSPSARYTWGFRNASVLAALLNAFLLAIAVGAIAWEAVRRFIAPEPVAEWSVIVVAAIGIAVNGLTAFLFASGRKGDLNIRGAYLHMAADAAVSAGVVLAGVLMLATGWLWLDPVTSLLIVAVIAWSSWSLLPESLSMSMAAVPAGVDPAAVRGWLLGQPEVSGLHDLHIWPISTTETALTAHLCMPGGHPGDVWLMRVAADLETRFRIGHTTLQVETDPATHCALEPDHVV